MQQQTKKFLTTNATTCPTSRNYCVTSELLLVLFKKVRDSFLKETRKLLYNWVGPKLTSHNWLLLFDPISEIFLSSSLKKISVQSSFGHLNYFHLIDWCKFRVIYHTPPSRGGPVHMIQHYHGQCATKQSFEYWSGKRHKIKI